MLGNKITPAWALIQKSSMNPTENWRVPIYQTPKFTEKHETAQKEAKKKQKYKRYKQYSLIWCQSGWLKIWKTWM